MYDDTGHFLRLRSLSAGWQINQYIGISTQIEGHLPRCQSLKFSQLRPWLWHNRLALAWHLIFFAGMSLRQLNHGPAPQLLHPSALEDESFLMDQVNRLAFTLVFQLPVLIFSCSLSFHTASVTFKNNHPILKLISVSLLPVYQPTSCINNWTSTLCRGQFVSSCHPHHTHPQQWWSPQLTG